MTETGKVVQLNQDIGHHLLTFLEGIDASNFLETVNNSNQFRSLATTSDQVFSNLLRTLCCNQRILLPIEKYEGYLIECDAIDDNLVSREMNYCSCIQPIQRLFVHPCFSIEGFGQLCKAYRTSIFECYSRLLSFNTDLYNADFGLLDYEVYSQTISSPRDLNDYEKRFFKISTYFNIPNNQSCSIATMFVSTVNEFRKNFADRFLSSQWIDTIDFSKFAIVGGSVVNALCLSAFPDTGRQDINMIYPFYDPSDFEQAVTHVINKLKTMTPKPLKHKIIVEKIPGLHRYDISLPCGVKLNFLYTPNSDSQNPLSHALYNFDIDLCQVAFIGNKIICTFAFMQALATKSFIVYSLHAKTPKHVCNRIAKYCERGFSLLEPINFDGRFEILMEQNEIPLYHVKHHNIIDEDGEIHSAITEYRRQFVRNIDTFHRQEAFIDAVCSQT